MNKQKSCISAIAVFLCLCFCFEMNAKATSYSWFFKSNGKDRSPSLMGESGIENHPSVLALGNPDEKTIYLTFDAGYSTENVEKILDVLKEEKVKAAFFILPAVYKYSPQVASRMAEEGHLVCNHTKTHANVSTLSFSELEKEIIGLEEEYEKYTGKKMAKFFRPPEGAFSKTTFDDCEKLGYKCVFWSFAYADWDNNAQKNPEWAKEKIISSMHNGCVLLLHPNSKTNADILKDVIKELKNEGYTFETLEHLSAYKEKSSKPKQ